MQPTHRVVVLLFAVTTMLTATRPASAQSTSQEPPAESNTLHIVLNCSRDRVRVRLFDAGGKKLSTWEDVEVKVGKPADVVAERRYMTAAGSFVTTSESKGCRQGAPSTDDNKEGRPIHVFQWEECSNRELERPVDLVLTSEPKATFTVVRQVERVKPLVRVPNANLAAPCQWTDVVLPHGARILSFRADEKLVITAESNETVKTRAGEFKMRGRLDLNWRELQQDSGDGKPVKTTRTPKPVHPGQNDGSRSRPAEMIAPTLPSFTLEVRPSP